MFIHILSMATNHKNIDLKIEITDSKEQKFDKMTFDNSDNISDIVMPLSDTEEEFSEHQVLSNLCSPTVYNSQACTPTSIYNDENTLSSSTESLENSSNNDENKKQVPNCKRCGVIFVDIQTLSNYEPPVSRENSDNKFGWISNKKRVYKIHSFLVVRGKTSNIWSFPKGRTNFDEEDENVCAERECHEETGICVNTKELPRITIGKNVYFIKHCRKEEFQKFVIHDDYEVGEVAWKTIGELRKYRCNKDLRAVLSFPKQNPQYYDIVYKRFNKENNFFKGRFAKSETNIFNKINNNWIEQFV